MAKATFNNVFSLECPEGFVQLSEEEQQKFFLGKQLRLTFQDKEKHILISLSKGNDSFLNRLFSNKAVIRGAASNMKNNLKDFESLGEEESVILGKPAITRCFSYVVNDQDIKQYGELSVFKIKSAFYVVHCLSRFESKEESKKVFKQIIDSFASVNA